MFGLFVFLHIFRIVCGSEYEGGGADLAHLGSRVFGRPSNESGRRVEKWTENSGVNPEELGEYAEGDILFPAARSRNGLIAETARWTDGEVPFEIAAHFSNSELSTIKNAMEEYHRHTCIRFRRRGPSDSDYVAITSSGTGCWSSVGRTGGRQIVNLQSPGCLARIGTVMHELLHALGFQHEQNRWERDSYVTINWQNIQQGREGNFKMQTKDSVSGFGIPYDYGSVMHYSEKAFSKNGEKTISVLKDTSDKVGQREGFSQKDIEKVRRMYHCDQKNLNFTEVDVEGQPDAISNLVSLFFP